MSMPAGPLDSSTDPSGARVGPSQPDGLPAWQPAPRPALREGNEDQRRLGRSPPSLALRDMGMIFRTIEQLTVKLNRLKVRAWDPGGLSPLRRDPSPTRVSYTVCLHGSPRSWPGALPSAQPAALKHNPSPGPHGEEGIAPSPGAHEQRGLRADVPLQLFQDMELAHKELLRSLGGESSGGTTPVGGFHTQAARWIDSSLSPPAKEHLASDSRDSCELGPCPEDGE